MSTGFVSMFTARGRSTATIATLMTAAACGDDTVATTDSPTSSSTTDAETSTGEPPTSTSTTTTTTVPTTGTVDSDSGTTTTTTTDSTTTGTTTDSTSSTSTGATTDSTSSTTTGTTTDSTSTTTTTGTSTTTTTTGEPPCQGPDSDDDTVADECDVCPGSDDLVDGDGDGVPDGCDQCQAGDDTIDGDGDGVADACDPCPADNPDDSDGDGVCNGVDQCPDGDDDVDVDEDGVPDACDDDVVVELPASLYDFDTADDGTLVLSRFDAGQVFVTCYNPDLSVRKAEFAVGTYDLEPSYGPNPTVNIARTAQKVLVTWHDPSGPADPRLEYAYLDSACNVLVPETTALTGVPYVEYHDTAITADGRAVIAASRDDTRVTFIDANGAITSQQVAFDIGSTYGNHVAINQVTGEGVVSAQQHSGSTLYYRRFNADGSWKDAAVVPVAINNYYWYDGHTVGMNDKGQFMLLWRSSSTQLDARMFAADGSVLADVQRATPNFEGGTPYDSFRRRHSEIQLRGDNFVFGETYLSKPVDLEVMHFEYTPAGALVVEGSTAVSVPMVLVIRVTPGGRTYLHDGTKVTLLADYP